jgi:hypothetical protein
MSNKNSTDDWVKISTKDFANKEDFLGDDSFNYFKKICKLQFYTEVKVFLLLKVLSWSLT